MILFSKKYIVSLICLSILLPTLTHCTSMKPVRSQPAEDQSLLKQYQHILKKQYPDSFALSQRIILKLNNRQYDFLGQLVLVRSGNFRATAFGELGGKFIDLLIKEHQIFIMANPAQFPEKILTEALVGDIKHLFDYQPSEKDFIYLNGDSAIGIIQNVRGNTYHDYLINRSPQQLLRSLTIENDKMIREVTYFSYQKYNPWQDYLPSRILLTNFQWSYSLEIQILQMSLDIDGQRAFSIDGME